ncbi:twin-arginine translocase subunit TatB [Sulfitobacter sp. SK012]|uniref:Sec-independent protein translocase protein TatB n=1 Tax=Sulfitobacter sp. SK012 TaxID=1389005 RepID=UPI000E0B966D|nr:Sec-independent protein translocase protein TatB [Sulfitobacter sp. SK012]AXI46113.1 twin-arginine translocase subunit TatB [Sulfitobacter sp. SK012]
MFGMGWSELLIVGIVALIVVGPKDLPIMFRQVGQFMGKAKGMASEFTSAMNSAADDSGVRDISRNLNTSIKAASNPLGSALDGVKSAASSLTDIDPDSETGKLAAKRADEVKKIQASTARAAADRKAREATDALARADEMEATLTPDAAPAKPAAKKAPAKKPAAKKAPVRKAAPKKVAAKKPAAQKTAKKSDT